MKVFVVLALAAVAAAEPQFFYNAPLATYPAAFSPYTYGLPIVKKVEEDKKVEVEAIKPVIYANNYAPFYNTYAHSPLTYTYAAPAYTKVEAIPRYHAKNGEVEHKVYKRSADAQYLINPYTYNYGAFPYAYNTLPYTYGLPIVKKAEEDKKVEVEAIKPVIYANNYAPFYNTYAHSPLTYTYAAPAFTKVEAIPRYHAKNGEVEHKVYKRSADAQYLINPYTYNYGAFPYTYNTLPYTYSLPIVKKAEEEDKKVEVEAIKPVIYANNYAPFYNTYAHSPIAYTYAAPTVAKVEAIPRYHAKVGEVEHKVYKRSADAQYLINPYTYNYGAFPYTYSALPYTYTFAKPEEKSVEMKEEKPEEIKLAAPAFYSAATYAPYTYAPYTYPAYYY